MSVLSDLYLNFSGNSPYYISGALTVRAGFPWEALDFRVRPKVHEPDDLLGRLLGCRDGGRDYEDQFQGLTRISQVTTLQEYKMI